MHTYPQDFAVPGSAGALNALVKSVLGKTYLLHYGSDFLPFLEHLPSIVDCDAAWAQKTEPLLDDTDDPYSISDGEDESLVVHTDSAPASRSSMAPSHENSIGSSYRERKQSLPLSAKALIMPIPSPHGADIPEITRKQLLKELYRHSLELQSYDCSEIAEEITRVEAKLFMEIEVSCVTSHLQRLSCMSHTAKTLVTIYTHSRSQTSRLGFHLTVQLHFKSPRGLAGV
jgi:hypothetical protein